MVHNINNCNCIVTEHFNFISLMLFIAKKKTWECKMELVRMRADEVILKKIKDSEELIIVIGGSGGVIINGEGTRIKAGDVVYIPRNALRSVANINKAELLQVVFITMNSIPNI